jgi:hypothetical protein
LKKGWENKFFEELSDRQRTHDQLFEAKDFFLLPRTSVPAPGSLMHMPQIAAPEQASGRKAVFCAWEPF